MTKSEQNELVKFLQIFFKFYFLIKMIPIDRESFKTYFKPSSIILMIDKTYQRLKNIELWLAITKVILLGFTIQGYFSH